MSSSPIRIIKNFKLPKEEGTYHRLICMTGRNKGLSYFFDKKRIILGRAGDADIQVLDTQCSRQHAELALIEGNYILTDLGSQNGVIINNKKMARHTLKDDDKIVIGKILFKYNIIHIEEAALAEFSSDQNLKIQEENHQKEISSQKTAAGKASRRGPFILILGILVLSFLFFEEEPKKEIKKNEKEINLENLNLDRKISSNFEESVRKEHRIMIHRGRRELREKNFFRAIENFNLALIKDPASGEAKFLLKRAKQRLDEFLTSIQKRAENEANQRKYQGALLRWCEIVRHLKDYPEDKRYLLATKNINILSQKLGHKEKFPKVKNEHKCF